MMRHLALAFLVFSSLAFAEARQVDEYAWEGVERIVAVGDLHGDFENYLATLRAAGIVDKKGNWSGGATHLVQTGDIPDRGPDTAKIIEHIRTLAKQARRKGGHVHNLIGNHEAMNVYGDLRYVSEGEYEAFVTRRSAGLRDRYFELYMKSFEAQDPESFAVLPEDFRNRWNASHPLGWVEHRQAWDPSWNPDGEFATWVLDNKVAVRINDNLFVHGGISGFYCRNSLASLTEKVSDELRNFDPGRHPPGRVWTPVVPGACGCGARRAARDSRRDPGPPRSKTNRYRAHANPRRCLAALRRQSGHDRHGYRASLWRLPGLPGNQLRRRVRRLSRRQITPSHGG